MIVSHVPYVTAEKKVKFGKLISTLALAGDVTLPPDTHVVHFAGEYPCHSDGTPIQQLKHHSADTQLAEGLTANHSFSNKPPNGYPDYYEKMATYVAILSNPAAALDQNATAKTFLQAEAEEESPFQYTDTCTARAGIGAAADRLKGLAIGIVGLGGTGAYVLDLVAKTPVREIHLFDRDRFVQHNAFRAPGAASVEQLGAAPFKTEYYREIYSRMHKRIVSHPENVAEETIAALPTLDFVFICIDKGPIKQALFNELERRGASFIDVGMGVHAVDARLHGIVRVTLSTPGDRASARSRVSFADAGPDEYKNNIQIADLNMLNAALAVMRWKKLYGVYQDFEKEHHSSYTIDVNMLLSEAREA